MTPHRTENSPETAIARSRTQLSTGSGPLPIRIYALAKQLKLDSKVLVDICTKAGVVGKGSALASLTDEELAKVMAFMDGGKGARPGGAPAGRVSPTGHREAAAPPSPGVFRREDYIAPAGTTPGRVPVLPANRRKSLPR